MIENVRMDLVLPDPKNPRRDFGDISALAGTFAVNDGYPVNPIVVVRDGGVYRIVDGERRYRAMKLLGKDECPAVVYETMEDAGAAAAMVATDEKQALTPEERSRGVQQMLLLGLAPEKVEKAARLKAGEGARIAKARRMAGAAGETMTIERMLAISEFEEGDPAVKELEEAPEKDWRRSYERILREREEDALVEKLLAAAEEAGVEVAEDRPEGFVYGGFASDPDDVAAKASEGCVALVQRGWRTALEFFAPPSAEDAEKERREAEERASRDALRAAADKGRARRKSYFAGNMASQVVELLEDAWFGVYGDSVATFEDETGIRFERRLVGGAALALAYQRSAGTAGELNMLWRLPDEGEAAGFLTWLEAFEAAGYEADEADELCRETCRSIVDGAES